MCEGCYEEYGRPVILNEKTRRGAELVRQLYEVELAGGNMHIVTDDWNLEDDNVKRCSEEIKEPGIERDCCDAFLAMTEPERASALALADGYLTDTAAADQQTEGIADETT